MISNRDMKFFKIAREVSLLSEFQPEHVGAVIVQRNEILSVGYNRNKSSPTMAFWSAKAGRPEAIYDHAEISCLKKLMSGCDVNRLTKIYVYRQTKAEDPALAKPCEICTMALRAFGIQHIYYTIPGAYGYEFWERS